MRPIYQIPFIKMKLPEIVLKNLKRLLKLFQFYELVQALFVNSKSILLNTQRSLFFRTETHMHFCVEICQTTKTDTCINSKSWK